MSWTGKPVFCPMAEATLGPMDRYVALLRGINVGGNNVIRMADLQACFEGGGFEEVRTYIQSGNVVFTSPKARLADLTGRIEEMLRDRFAIPASVVVRSRRQMRDIVARAPEGFGSEPTAYRYDVIFLKPPLTVAAAIQRVKTKEGVDTAATGPGVLYFSRLIARATQSQLARIVSDPVYQRLTIRNWNTTATLAEMMD